LPLLLVVVSVNAVGDAAKYWSRVSPSETSRAAFLSERFGGYDLLTSTADKTNGPIYQFGFEGELYYLGNAVRGDWFGPGRYREVIARAHDAAALAEHLKGLGADSLLLNLQRSELPDLPWDAVRSEPFELVAKSHRAALYRITGKDEATASDFSN
jgi:hypothetical protein